MLFWVVIEYETQALVRFAGQKFSGMPVFARV